jgi:hypothetical protein
MSLELAIRQVVPQEPARRALPLGSGDDIVGSSSAAAEPKVGPANPRMRIDRDLGMVVIEFRDAAGRLTSSLPTNREIEAYRASVLFGADLPADVSPMNVAGDGPSAARPGIPMPPPEKETPVETMGGGAAASSGLDRVV